MNRPLLAVLIASYVCVIASNSSASWQPQGVAVGAGAENQERPVIASDGRGGSIVAWTDDRLAGQQRDIYVQRLDPFGVPQWTPNGVPLCTAPNDQQDLRIISDGAGGAIVTWRDFRSGTNSDIFAQRVNASGVPSWTANGVALCTVTDDQNDAVIASDGQGGAIVAWRDRRNGVDYDIYARRVSSIGTAQWTSNGVALGVAAEDQTIPSIIADGAGGAIVAWFDRRNSPDADVYAQKVNAAGVRQWTANGVVVSAVQGIQRTPELVSDGGGGAIICWWDSRNGTDFEIFAQRINSGGVLQWTAHGVPVCTRSNDQQVVQMVPDGTGGAIVTWEDFRNGFDFDLYAQRLNSAGAPQWADDGIALCTMPKDQVDATIAADATGGAILAWVDDRSDTTDIYAGRVNSSGSLLWTLSGAAVSTAPDDQTVPSIIADGTGGAFIAWQDQRNGSDTDVYAQHLTSAGSFPTAVVDEAWANRIEISPIYPNPFADGTSLDVRLPARSLVLIELYDVMGRRIRRIANSELGAGSNRLMFDGRDAGGRPLPNGVYFYRLGVGGQTQVRKMVVSR